ncbi:MAG: glucose-6-phosphate dehydrogenase assembly protein OpcA [Candidatus Dormibacteraeota bacterium]|uniref:Glucose-6-phosphate dehydrogenase assembly protein OpcA n=1 Tax=Candidatus Dormiibacter inghamiae TaxID=3127013 RepID=A0A934KA37_9BACT|nr:glucose-6-phosphate dehydrogenase assembly protein OpcA [Candidatus Dormibacteraeota bacterium]MBJ7607780.1 glucose-6-phosphate dehydrogenase assembly protein OpcA [Candidatus Dormibacteraeota bacterium]
MASSVAKLHSDRVRERRWSGKGVTLGEVLSHLSELHHDISHTEAEDQGHPHPRNSVMNLVVCVGSQARAEETQEVVERMAASHPLRAVVIRRAGEKDRPNLDAEIVTEAHQLVRGETIQREQIYLAVSGPAADHLASFVEPLLAADVPTYLWWAGTPPLGERGLRNALAICDVLIVDSAGFEKPATAFLEFAGLADRLGGRIGFADLHWSRQRPWRESLSQFFSPPERRVLLGGIGRFDIDCAGEGQAAWVGGSLLTGWIAGALGWRLLRAAAVTDEHADAIYEAPGGALIPVALRSSGRTTLPRGTATRLRLEAESGGLRCLNTIELHPERDDHAHMTIELAGQPAIRQRLALPPQDESELLVQALAVARRDRVFMRSLSAAAELQDGLR